MSLSSGEMDSMYVCVAICEEVRRKWLHSCADIVVDPPRTPQRTRRTVHKRTTNMFKAPSNRTRNHKGPFISFPEQDSH